MDNIKSTAPSSYVTTYGMTREPFADTIEDDLFYPEPSRKQKLDILLHLTQYGNELMLVTGPEGSGKTTLLQQYLRNALDTWSVARIEAKGGIDERKLLQQLFHQMGMEFQGATHSELLERMKHHFDSLQHSARQAVMLVDDADQLPVTARQRLLDMAALTSADNKPLLRVILFGTSALEDNFNDPMLERHTNLVRRVIDLPPFDSEHTTHYILNRLSAAHFAEDKPFTASVLQKIHRQSKGWPGAINQLAHNTLIETAPSLFANSRTTFNIVRGLVAVTGTAIIVALLFFQDEFNTWLKDGTTATDTVSQAHAPAPDAEPAPADAHTDQLASAAPDVSAEMPAANVSPVDAQIDKILAPMSLESPSSLETPSEDQPLTTTEATEATETKPEPAPATVAENPTEETTPVAKITAEPAAPIDSPAASATPVSHKPIAEQPVADAPAIPADLPGFREDWILQQNPSHYTLQLVAGKNINTLRQFVNEHSLDEPLAIYRATRKGEPWFGMIYHTYPNKQAAIAARGKLPAPLRKPLPWVRPFSGLQQDISASRGGTP